MTARSRPVLRGAEGETPSAYHPYCRNWTGFVYVPSSSTPTPLHVGWRFCTDSTGDFVLVGAEQPSMIGGPSLAAGS